MTPYYQDVFPKKRLTQAVAMALVSLMATGSAYAQQADQAATATSATAPAKESKELAKEKIKEEVTTVTVVGARASQRSAIGRKKYADTAQDSIVAEDVGAFPDRNVADAISRIAGVAVDRGDYGEGVTVSIRGNGPELTRVELDGQGVQQAGGTDMVGGIAAGTDSAGGRGVELRQLSSDLIKSVDVIKGSTADMTEGSLGGSVKIQTRTGLDFKSDYLSVRAAAQQNSINKKVNPNLNLVGAKKFMNGRLGVLVNLSASKLVNENHKISQGGSNDQAGATRPLDFDNSPEKTVALRPETLNLNDVASTTPYYTGKWTTPLADGTTDYKSLTPQQLLEGSAAAKTKDDCYKTFPIMPTAQSSNLGTGGSLRYNAINISQLALLTCLGQWNDWMPSNNGTRYMVNQADDRRKSGDIRLDFKVNENLTVYTKFSRSKGDVIETNSILSTGGYNTAPGTVRGPNGYVGPALLDTNSTAQLANGTWGSRTVVPGSGYYLYPNEIVYRGASNTVPGAITGLVANIDPASVKVDDSHHVTSYQIADGVYGVDNTKRWMGTNSTYIQAGGTFRKGILKAEFLLGSAHSEMYRIEKRAGGFSTYVGPTNAQVEQNGLWSYTPVNPVDVTSANSYVTIAPSGAIAKYDGNAVSPPNPAYASSQLPLTSAASTLSLQQPRINEQREKTAKLDITLRTDDYLSFIPQVKLGWNHRKTNYDAWSTGGFAVQDAVGTPFLNGAGFIPGIYVPTVNLRTTWQICQDTPGSLAPGGLPCKYGYTPNPDPNKALFGSIVISPEQYKNLFATAFTNQPTSQFYAGDPKRGATLTNGWTSIDIDKLYDTLGVPNYNLDCIKECVGSDGKMYKQPYSAIAEQVDAGYLMANFDIDRFPFTQRSLPFGLSFDGNIGVRAVKTKVKGTGLLTFQSITVPAGLDPTVAANQNTRTYRQTTSLNASTTDYLPSVNVNTWLVPDKVVARYNWGKTVARPSPGRLIPNGTCIYNTTLIGTLDPDGSEADMRCTDVMGNPELKPQTNHNQNLSLEWYPNKDTMLSAAVYKQEGIIGAPSLIETLSSVYPFAGSNAIDPQTGTPLADVQFTERRWTNQLASTRTGFEVSGKVAFTILPWYLRYTGLDANYTRNKSKLSDGGQVVDLISGAAMPIAGEPHHSWNASLWYDDGALSMRVALQVKASVFNCISACNSTAVNNYPALGLTTVRFPTYLPSTPSFRYATRYLDAKIGYKFKNGLELFLEGRNLGRIHTGNDTGGYSTFSSGAPMVYYDSYAGRSFMAGLNFKMGGN